MARAKDLRARAAGRFIVGFEGTAMSPELRELLDMGVAGVILFRRNVVDPRQVAELNADIVRATKGRPVFISVDQEGGPVQRLRAPFTEFPPHVVLGVIDDVKLTAKVATVMARELRALGFNTDYAPVADVNTNPANPVIGIRAFGSEPELVARHVKAWTVAMQAAGVMGCAKHFPGHGDTSVDSHLALPRVPHSLARMNAVELVPFRAAIAARVGSIMTAHVVFEALQRDVPATLSAKALEGLLRKNLGYKGLVVSDDLEMKAIANRVGVPEAAVSSLEAGADLLLVCKTRELVLGSIDAVARAMERKGRLLANTPASERRIAAAVQRFLVGAGKRGDGLHRPPNVDGAMKLVGRASHQRVADEVARRATKAGSSWSPPSLVTQSQVSTT